MPCRVFVLMVAPVAAVAAGAVDEVAFPELSGETRRLYEDIYEPTVVGTPPENGYRALTVRPDGEIRHYGWKRVSGKLRRVYVASDDNGLSWRLRVAEGADYPGPMVKSPWSGDWLTVVGGWTTEREADEHSPLRCLRAANGPKYGITSESEVGIPTLNYYRQMQPLVHWKRWLVPGAVGGSIFGLQHVSLALSDDDGRTWRQVTLDRNVTVPEVVPPDRFCRWDNGCCEPAVVELKDGTLLMMARATREHHYRYVSHDGGETWEGPEKAEGFYSRNTMPTFLKLRDGRILFFWNNTKAYPLPDPNQFAEAGDALRKGIGEFVFTNRDALHCAISEDDGKTWIGFREVFLNPLRNDSDFRELGNTGLPGDNDKSVHQSQALELPDGKILLSAGQNSRVRRLILFDVRWLYETSREDDFRHGFAGLSNHLYVKGLSGGGRGWAGHCAWNRVAGAKIVRDPDTDGSTIREVLQLCRIRDPRLVSDRQGIVWNFPAGKRGHLEIDCRIDGQGFLLSLCDRWINPSDEYVSTVSPLSVNVDAEFLGGAGRWAVLNVDWDWDEGKAVVFCGDKRKEVRLSRDGYSPFGLSYLHLQTLAEAEDVRGAYFRAFRKSVQNRHLLVGGTDKLLEGRRSWPLPMDYDGDGVLDLLVTSPGENGGTWLFKRTQQGDSRAVTSLSAGVWVCEGAENVSVSTYGGRPVVLAPSRVYWNFPRDNFTSLTGMNGTQPVFRSFYPDGVTGSVWRYCDYNGDGVEDLIVGMGNRVYRLDKVRGGLAWDAGYGAPTPLKDESGSVIEMEGMPFPMIADFDGDGDLDLLCGSDHDTFVYFENKGTRKRFVISKGRPVLSDSGENLSARVSGTTPVAVDWDSDGLVDILCGGADGRVSFMKNLGVGNGSVPVFARPVVFTGAKPR